LYFPTCLLKLTSVYLADTVVPMLPERLSNGICSLRPDEDKLCFSAVFTMDGNAVIKETWFGRTVIHSNRRFSYEEAEKVIESGKGDCHKAINAIHNIAEKLRKKRIDNGAISFESIDVRFRFDKAGKPIEIYFKEAKKANHLIEEFMLLANKGVAEYVGKKLKKPFVYRIHDSPNQEKLEIFMHFIDQFGHKLNTKSKADLSRSFNKIMANIKGKKEANIIEKLSIRTMEKAIYTMDNIGHYGLAFPYYSHFTSPIRRYPDMMVHRLMAAYLSSKKLSASDVDLEHHCKHASEMEKKAANAERASVKFMQVQFLMDKVGQTFDALISGVTEWGLFVEIQENKCEGLVRLQDIDDDFYVFDEDNFCVVGYRSGRKYQLGDRVMVMLKKADLVRKQLDFELITEYTEEG